MDERDEWKDLDPELARTVLRQGEVMLDGQLRMALAADQRAVTLAAIFTPVALAVLGLAGAALKAGEVAGAWGGLSAGVALIAAALLCVLAARPVPWWTAGNVPDCWWRDGVENHALAACLRKESTNYDGRIRDNQAVRGGTTRLLQRGAMIGAAAPLFGLAAWAAVTWASAAPA